MTPVAIYARYSTEEQDPRSIDDQVRRCTEHATAKSFEVVAKFSDEAISGAHTDRTSLRRMLDAATSSRRPPFRAVLVDDLSRLSRNIGDTWRMLDDLAAAGVRVIDVQTGMSSDAPNARQMFGMKSLFNDQMLETIRYQTHRGLEGRAIAGFSTGGSQYGYSTVPEPHPSNPDKPRKAWIIESDETAIVRRVFTEYADGAASYKSIADRLNRDGVPAPRDMRRGHKIGRGWGHTTILAMLTNRRYIGEWTWNQTKWVNVPGKRKRRRLHRPESEHVTRVVPELAIVDRALFDRVQARIERVHKKDKSGTRRGRPPGAGSRPYLVSGMLRCGVCGGSMSICSARTKNGVRYANFGCTAHRSRGASICANAATISEKKVSEALVGALRDALTSPEFLELLTKAFERRIKARTGAKKPADLEAKLRAAEQRVTNATRLIVEMPDDLELRRQRETDKVEARRLQAVIAEQVETKPRVRPEPDALRKAISTFVDKVTTATPEGGRELISSCMPPLTVTPAPKNEKPGLVVTGSVVLRGVLANCSSGGARFPPAKTIPLPFASVIVRRA